MALPDVTLALPEVTLTLLDVTLALPDVTFAQTDVVLKQLDQPNITLAHCVTCKMVGKPNVTLAQSTHLTRCNIQGCCAGTGKFQYYVNSVYFCQFQYFLMPFHVLKSVQHTKFCRHNSFHLKFCKIRILG